MVGEIRRKQICDLLKKNSAVTTLALSKQFGVSIETIRKDLLKLENENELERVHGGAVLKSAIKKHISFPRRLESMVDEKKEISHIAASFIKNGDVIAIDAGSTAAEFIRVIMDYFDTLTIVTHSVDVFEAVRDYKNYEIILCGGFYLKGENSFYGDFVLNTLDNLRVEKAFIFPAAISLKNGICDFTRELSQIQKKIISCANEIFVVADSSKYEKSALLKSGDMNKNFYYITDSKLPREIKEIYKENEIKLITETNNISSDNKILEEKDGNSSEVDR